MRPFEILSTALVCASLALMLYRPVARRLLQFNCLLTALALALHFAFEGAHWQTIPLYAAALLLLASVLWQDRWPRFVRVLAITGGLLLAAGAVGLSWLMPMIEFPKLTGPCAVGTRLFYLVDSSRNEDNGPSPSGKRELMVQAWYPAERPDWLAGHLANYQRRGEVTLRASYRSVLKTRSYQDAPVLSGGPYPVLLYNPSWMGERTEGTYQTEELASHGFVVVAIDHTFFGGLVEFPDGRVVDSHSAPELGSFDHTTVEQEWSLGSKYVHIEAQDDIFVLDRLTAMNADPASPLYRKLDLSHVGAMGFSIGGAVAEQAAWQDPRVSAALNMDGWTFGDAGLHGLAKPLMVFYEDKSKVYRDTASLGAASPAERAFWEFSNDDFARVTEGLRRNGGFLLFLTGTQHVDFTDRSLFSPLPRLTGRGTIDPTRAHQIVNAYTLAFFERFLQGKSEPLLEQIPSPFPEAEFDRFPIDRP